MILGAEFIWNPDGSIYHLNLRPEQLADTVILVGDADRAALVMRYMDVAERVEGRMDILSFLGRKGGRDILLISTGQGMDNVDVVMNELDALANIDSETRSLREQIRRLRIVRIGSGGSIHGNIALGTVLVSELALGFDPRMEYNQKDYGAEDVGLRQAIATHFSSLTSKPYLARVDDELMTQLAEGLPRGMTMTLPGFYGMQGHVLRSHSVYPDLVLRAKSFCYAGQPIVHVDMETAVMYALANILGHQALSLHVVTASRVDDGLDTSPEVFYERAVKLILNRL